MIVNTWACERVVPVCASGHTLDKCYLDIQDHLPTQQGCDSASNPIEQSRLFLASIKDTILTPVNTSTLSELRGLKLDNDLPPHLKMMLLSGAITNHHLHTPTSLPCSAPNTINYFSTSTLHLQCKMKWMIILLSTHFYKCRLEDNSVQIKIKCASIETCTIALSVANTTLVVNPTTTQTNVTFSINLEAV